MKERISYVIYGVEREKRSHGNGMMKKGHQMMRMSGVQNMQPNLRTQPFVIDPFE